MTILLWAAVAMFVQDVLAVCMVQAEAGRNKPQMAALDAVQWLCGLVTNHYSLNAVNGHNRTLEVLVILCVTAANIVGSWSGGWIAERVIHPKRDPIWGLLIDKGIVSEEEAARCAKVT